MAGDDTTEGSRPLSNDDFRRLLATPRPGTAADDAGRKRRPKPHKAKSQPVPEVEQSLYRDRAAERRRGEVGPLDASGAQAWEAERLAGADPGEAGDLWEEDDAAASALGDIGADEDDLGGAFRPRGLDFALLRKARRERADKAETAADAGASGKSSAAPSASLPRPPSAHTVLGRSLLAVLHPPGTPGLAQPRARPSDLFRPRKTAFVYDLGGASGSGEPGEGAPPTTLLRPEEEVPPDRRLVHLRAPGALLDRLARLGARLVGGSASHRRRGRLHPGAGEDEGREEEVAVVLVGSLRICSSAEKREGEEREQSLRLVEDRGGEEEDIEATAPPSPGALLPPPSAPASAAPPAPEEEEEEDIFADAGTDYVVEYTKKKPADEAISGPALPEVGVGYTRAQDAYPDTDAAYPDTDAAYPDTDAAYPDTDAAYPDTDAAYPDTDAAYPGASLPTNDASVPAGRAHPFPSSALAEAESRKAKAKPKKPSLIDAEGDAYEELYPSYAPRRTVLDEDSDEEGVVVRGADEGELRTREEWDALQAGGRGRQKGGRGGQKREAERQAAREESKLNSELHRIQSVFEEKGYSGREAFVQSSSGAPQGGLGDRKKRRI